MALTTFADFERQAGGGYHSLPRKYIEVTCNNCGHTDLFDAQHVFEEGDVPLDQE
jgi:hypothetical protein